MPLPQTVDYNGRPTNIFTYEQLEQQPRRNLKNRAKDLQDLIGADRLPPLVANGSVESVTVWILEVECALLKMHGIEATPFDLGMPNGFGTEEEENMFNHAKGKSREPIREITQGVDSDGAAAAYAAAMEAAAATRQRNQMGSNIFG